LKRNYLLFIRKAKVTNNEGHHRIAAAVLFRNRKFKTYFKKKAPWNAEGFINTKFNFVA